MEKRIHWKWVSFVDEIQNGIYMLIWCRKRWILDLSLVTGGSWCHWLWDAEELGHDGSGLCRGWPCLCDRHGHHWEIQSQPTVPVQTLGCTGERERERERETERERERERERLAQVTNNWIIFIGSLKHWYYNPNANRRVDWSQNSIPAKRLFPF